MAYNDTGMYNPNSMQFSSKTYFWSAVIHMHSSSPGLIRKQNCNN